jgi:hypothetical protein
MLPEYLERFRNDDAGRAWLDALPRLVAECAQRWQLRLGEPFAGGSVSLPVAATLPDGGGAVLKLQFPDRESEHEAAALDALRTLPASQGEQVLLHQDLHAGNVLRAQREPWLAIDPKPLTGEREFGIAAIVRGSELGHGRRQVLRRLDRLSDELALDRERARLWALAQTIAWCPYGDDLDRHVDVARWLLEAGPR